MSDRTMPYQAVDEFEKAGLNIFRKSRMILRSPLSVAECQELVACHTLPARSWENWLSKPGREAEYPLTGAVSDDGFRIRKTIDHSNSAQSVISGEFVLSSPGTIIELEISLSRWMRIFPVGAIAFSVLIELGLAASVVAEVMDSDAGVWLTAGVVTLVLILLPVLPLLILFLAVFLKRLAAGEAEFVIMTLTDLLEIDQDQNSGLERLKS